MSLQSAMKSLYPLDAATPQCLPSALEPAAALNSITPPSPPPLHLAWQPLPDSITDWRVKGNSAWREMRFATPRQQPHAGLTSAEWRVEVPCGDACVRAWAGPGPGERGDNLAVVQYPVLPVPSTCFP